MKMKLIELKQLVAMKRWQEWVNLALGGWLLIAPMLFAFTNVPFTNRPWTAMWTAWIFGGVIVLYSESANFLPQSWKEAFHILIGIALMLSPWLLEYDTSAIFTRNAVVVGLVTAVLAIWTIALEMDLRRRHRKQHLMH